MRLFLTSLFVSMLATVGLAGEAEQFLTHSGKVIAQPDFNSLPGVPWAIAKGKWEVANGVLVAAEKKEEKHSAVLWHNVSPATAVIECEFEFDGAGSFLIGCDGKKHIGRLVVTPKLAKLSEDSTEVKGVHPGATLAEVKQDLKRGQWCAVRYGWKDDKMFAVVDGRELVGQHPALSAVRARWWFAVGGESVHIRNVKVSEGPP